MNVLYRGFTWVAIAPAPLVAATLLTGGLSGALGLPDDARWPVAVLAFFGLLGALGAWVARKDALVEPSGVSRGQSALLWAAALLVVYPLGRWIGGEWPGSLYCGGVRTAWLLLAVAAGAVVFRPFARHVHGTRIGVFGIIGGLLLNLVASFVGDNFAFHGERLPWGYVMDEEWRERFFPANATDFTIEGWAGFMNFHVVWSCRVDEAGFRAFARQNGYEFRLITTDAEESALGPTGRFGDAKLAKPFYDHANAYDNGGGLFMRYSVPEQKLYGWFANR